RIPAVGTVSLRSGVAGAHEQRNSRAPRRHYPVTQPDAERILPARRRGALHTSGSATLQQALSRPKPPKILHFWRKSLHSLRLSSCSKSPRTQSKRKKKP